MVNEVVPHDQLMEHTYALAKRLALVPEPALRLNKAIAMQGMQAAGLHAALLLEGTLGALAHSSHNEYREELYDIQRTQGTKAYLERRDGPFQPEPMGPRSAKGRRGAGGEGERLERRRHLGHEARHLVLHARVRLEAEIEVEDHLVEARAFDLRLQACRRSAPTSRSAPRCR